ATFARILPLRVSTTNTSAALESVKTFDTPTHPNSLALSADGKTLYVSVKQKSTKQQEATQPDDVIRIAL
ncbi:hypothetical protein ACUOBA_10200, partial [Escherichia coli]